MSVVRVGKEIAGHGPPSAQDAPLARLRARFGFRDEPPTPAPSIPPRVAAELKLSEPPTDVSPWDLPPKLYERWEERVCIMHFDGKIPWQSAEALALADVLGQADPRAGKREAGPAPETAKAEQPAPVVQASLFAAEKGPYG